MGVRREVALRTRFFDVWKSCGSDPIDTTSRKTIFRRVPIKRQGAESRELRAESREQRAQEAGSRKQEAESRKLEAESLMHEWRTGR